MKNKGVVGATVLALSILISGLAVADEERDAAFYQKQFEAWANQVVQLGQADTHKVVSTHIEQIRTLIGQGQAFLASEKLEQIDPILAKADAIHGFSLVRIERASAEKRLEEAKQKAKAAEDAANSTRTQADQLDAHAKQLEALGL